MEQEQPDGTWEMFAFVAATRRDGKLEQWLYDNAQGWPTDAPPDELSVQHFARMGSDVHKGWSLSWDLHLLLCDHHHSNLWAVYQMMVGLQGMRTRLLFAFDQ